MGLLNFTTIMGVEQTIGEIQKLLSRYGVTALMTEYEGPNVSAVSFMMEIKGKKMGYKLPCNWRCVQEIFKNDPKFYVKHKDKSLDNQAMRTAWRVILVWIETQLALVEINMVTIPQIFLPYTIMKDGKTLSEHIEKNPEFLLGNGN